MNTNEKFEPKATVRSILALLFVTMCVIDAKGKTIFSKVRDIFLTQMLEAGMVAPSPNGHALTTVGKKWCQENLTETERTVETAWLIEAKNVGTIVKLNPIKVYVKSRGVNVAIVIPATATTAAKGKNIPAALWGDVSQSDFDKLKPTVAKNGYVAFLGCDLADKEKGLETLRSHVDTATDTRNEALKELMIFNLAVAKCFRDEKFLKTTELPTIQGEEPFKIEVAPKTDNKDAKGDELNGDGDAGEADEKDLLEIDLSDLKGE